MSAKSREVVWGGRIMGAKIQAQGARERAEAAVREADRAEAEAWSVRCVPIAAVLRDRGIPFAFASGYGADDIPARFRDRPTLRKPFSIEELAICLPKLLG